MPERIILTPTEQPATSHSVSLRTSDAVTAPQVQWALSGPSVTSGAQTVAAATSDQFDTTLGYPVAHHSATIEGLNAGTTYVYRVGDGETWSEWLEFTTATTEVGGFSFLVQGDAQNDNKAYTSRSFGAAFEARRDGFGLGTATTGPTTLVIFSGARSGAGRPALGPTPRRPPPIPPSPAPRLCPRAGRRGCAGHPSGRVGR